jgi:LPXTG-motif cell wall-anchored protein
MTLHFTRRITLALLAALLAMPLLLAAPAGAQGASPCPPGQPPGRPPGVPPGPPEQPPGRPEGRPPAYPSRSECQLRLDQSAASRGERVTLAGSGYRGGSDVELTLNSNPISLGNVTTNGSGAFSTSVVIPQSAPIGAHTITASGVDPGGAPFVLSAAFEVTASGAAAAPSAAGNTLPRTGTSTGLLVGASALLIAVGAALVTTARRRRTPVTA